MGYEIEFLGANNEPLAYYKAEMSINGLPTVSILGKQMKMGV